MVYELLLILIVHRNYKYVSSTEVKTLNMLKRRAGFLFVRTFGTMLNYSQLSGFPPEGTAPKSPWLYD